MQFDLNISSALCERYEIIRDPERWLDINRDTGDIIAKRTFNMRSPHVKNSIYNAVVKATGQLLYPPDMAGSLLRPDSNDAP